MLRRILPIPGWGVKLLATLAAAPLVAAPAGLLLTADVGPPPAGWTRLPDLTALVYQPDLFLAAGCRTIPAAAERLRASVDAAAEPVDWVRLETLDLTAVGGCETCAPPPVDPHRYVTDAPPVFLGETQFAFFRAAAALAGSGARPYLVVPPGNPPPAEPLPDDLLVLLAPPPLPAAASAAGLAAREAACRAWLAAAGNCWSLVTDGLGRFFDLPLTGGLLRRQAEALPRPAVLARDVAAFAADGPGWLDARLRAVVLDGARADVGDHFRTASPELARVLDVFGPLEAELGADPLTYAPVYRAVVQLLAVAEWDRQRAAGQDCTRLRDRILNLSGSTVPRDPLLPGELLSAVRAAGPLPLVTVPPAGAIRVDGAREEAEWQTALRLELTGDEGGRATDRPATAWLALGPTDLYLAVTATEPDRAEATLNDALVVTLGGPDLAGPAVRLTATVGGKVALQRLAELGRRPVDVPVKGVEVAGAFEPPGWGVEVRVPLALLGLDRKVAPWRVNLATEHRSGRLRTVTCWQPTGGDGWSLFRCGLAR